MNETGPKKICMKSEFCGATRAKGKTRREEPAFWPADSGSGRYNHSFERYYQIATGAKHYCTTVQW